MSRSTYYIVQTLGDMFIMRTADGRYVPSYDRGRAVRLSFAEARSIYRAQCRYAEKSRAVGYYAPRRFPRIIKVSIET